MVPSEKHKVRITPSGSLRAYVAYADRVLADPQIARVQLIATGKAIGRAISVAEILKRKHKALHQLTQLTPDAAAVRGGNTVSCLSILLAPSTQHVDTNHPGYAAPQEQHIDL